MAGTGGVSAPDYSKRGRVSLEYVLSGIGCLGTGTTGLQPDMRVALSLSRASVGAAPGMIGASFSTSSFEACVSCARQEGHQPVVIFSLSFAYCAARGAHAALVRGGGSFFFLCCLCDPSLLVRRARTQLVVESTKLKAVEDVPLLPLAGPLFEGMEFPTGEVAKKV